VTEARRRRKAKQARRDARRSRQRDGTPEETPLVGEVRAAIDSGDPMELLGLAAMVIEVASRADDEDDERAGLDALVEFHRCADPGDHRTSRGNGRNPDLRGHAA
jgi:hypothetical protein